MGAFESDRTSPNNSVEEFFSLIRFDQRDKLEELNLDSRFNEEIQFE